MTNKSFNHFKENTINIMPKRLFHKVLLTADQPDRCADCPLLGILPPDVERPRCSKKTLVCIATGVALSKRGSRVCKSQRDGHHLLHRPCDDKWPIWASLPGRMLPIKTEYYMKYRLPYETISEMKIIF